jgi:hypothetical protein
MHSAAQLHLDLARGHPDWSWPKAMPTPIRPGPPAKSFPAHARERRADRTEAKAPDSARMPRHRSTTVPPSPTCARSRWHRYPLEARYFLPPLRISSSASTSCAAARFAPRATAAADEIPPQEPSSHRPELPSSSPSSGSLSPGNAVPSRGPEHGAIAYFHAEAASLTTLHLPIVLQSSR